MLVPFWSSNNALKMPFFNIDALPFWKPGQNPAEYFYVNKHVVNGTSNHSNLVGGPHIDKQYSDVQINASHEDGHLFIVASQTSNMAVSDIRIGSDFEHCTTRVRQHCLPGGSQTSLSRTLLWYYMHVRYTRFVHLGAIALTSNHRIGPT